MIYSRITSSKKAFTFIEVLLVATMFALVGTALYGAFSSAIKLWDRSQRMVMEENVTVFFDKISEDLRNTFYYAQIRFVGREESLSFATTVQVAADPRSSREHEKMIDQIGRVSYYFDLTDRSIYRRQDSYAQALSDDVNPARKMIDNVRSLRFRYYFTGEEDIQEHDFTDDVIPFAIEVQVAFETDRGQLQEMKRFIIIPTGL